MLTVDQQFGVIWPEQFSRALEALSLLSMDLGVLGSMLCLVNLFSGGPAMITAPPPHWPAWHAMHMNTNMTRT